MSQDLKEGDIVICDTGQSGCLTHLDGNGASVLLLNLCMWHGPVHGLRKPQDDADLSACPLEVDRFEQREIVRPVKPKR